MAQQREVPVLQASWVDAVWEATTASGGQGEVAATDPQFLCHVCPVFLNQVVCVSQLPKADKLSIKKLVEENGQSVCSH